MCTHISWDLLFHLEGLRTPKEDFYNLESLFGKQDDLWGNILENELISLHLSSFESISKVFTKYKSLVLQCKQCGLERKYEQHVLLVMRNISSVYSVFVSIFHFRISSIPNWNIPSLDAFFESSIQEKDKLVQMWVIHTSKNKALLVTDSNNVQARGKHKGRKTKNID